MKLSIGDRVVARAGTPCDGDPPPAGEVGIVIGFAVRFPGHDRTWLFDKDELSPAHAVTRLGGLDDPLGAVGGSVNNVYGVEQ